jgi:uncharacterized protein (TIGR00730 family)
MNPASSHHRPSVCVFCGSRPGDLPAYANAARELGRQIGQRGWRLVYGGGKVGLMGIVADAALSAGAEVLGVIPESLFQREVGHRGLTELRVVQTMHERKQLMAETSDAFVALPGGIGTFEELFEVWTWQHLGYHAKPVALLDTAGYYRALRQFLAQARDSGFMSAAQFDTLQTHEEPAALMSALSQALEPSAGQPAPGDYRRI